MDHQRLLRDPAYAGWSEHRQEAHRALCNAAHHYAMVAFTPGPLMDAVCAVVVGDPGPDGSRTPLSARNREEVARDILDLPLPALDPPQQPADPRLLGDRIVDRVFGGAR